MIKRKRNKSRLKYIGSFIIVISIGLLACKYINYKHDDIKDAKKIEEFFKEEVNVEEDIIVDENKEEQKIIYDGVLQIPSINFKRGFYNLGNPNNTISKNIEILNNSNMPNVDNGILAIAGHSGNSRISFFNNLSKIKIDDSIFIYYENFKYTYKVTDNYEEKKDGNISIKKDLNNTILVLTTCSTRDKNKQVVVISKLVSKEKY